MNFELIFQWTLLIGGLIALGYAAIAIKEEKQAYRENHHDHSLGSFLFFTPSWWGQTSDDINEKLIFERTDTKYEWKAQVFLLKNKKSCEQIL